MCPQLTVLVAAGHSDDIELQCAGTLIRYVKEGHRVILALAMTGNVGTKTLALPEIEAVRWDEAQKGAKIIGVDEVIMLGHKDGEVWQDNRTWKQYVDLIRRVDPDVILTHDAGDFIHDHSNVGELAYRAAIWASVHNIPDCEYAPINHIPTVYFFENVGAHRPTPPTDWVDISEEWDQRMRAFEQHESQHGDYLQKQYGVTNWYDYVEAVAKLRGFQCGCRYAEAFRLALTWPNPKPYRLLPPVQYSAR